MIGRNTIKKAVFPVAGFGTRLLPVTKSVPKEMLPIINKPVIQYSVDEAIESGIDHLIFITSYQKRSIEDYFDVNIELEKKLIEQKKDILLDSIREIIPNRVHCSFIRQGEQLGLGHAVYCAKHLINENEFFSVILCDDLIDANPSCMKQMIDIHSSSQCCVIATQKVQDSDVNKYGIIRHRERSESIVSNIVEKPHIEVAPSNIAVVGRYILHYKIFKAIEDTRIGTINEIQLTDGINNMIENNRELEVRTYMFKGDRYDCGSKYGYVQANIEYAKKDSELTELFTESV